MPQPVKKLNSHLRNSLISPGDSFLLKWKEEIPVFDHELKSVFKTKYFENALFNNAVMESLSLGSDRLGQAIEYSLFTGGKRFRPMLTFASCQVLNKNFKEAMSWAMAVECIHTYSLIHDDLPCMDNDDERRGQPTVHKKFDEATALLAGDALLTEAFGLVGSAYAENKNVGALIQVLAERSGFKGMVSGQANDLAYNEANVTDSTQAADLNMKSLSLDSKDKQQSQVLFIHLQKTAALINAASVGPFLIFNQEKEVIKQFSELSLILGILFQLKDDFLDANIKIENNMVHSLGHDKTKSIYSKYKHQSELIIKDLSGHLNLSPYQELIDYNDTRNV
jgi:geranylgeranyl pyrophosphate synthase